jgi:hypothetical protein
MGIEHFQGSAAGVDLVVMREIREPFEDAEQLLVPGTAQDFHVAGAALRAARCEPRQLVAALWGGRHGEAAEGAHQMQCLALAGLLGAQALRLGFEAVSLPASEHPGQGFLVGYRLR